jgi:hypothetical protein
MTKRAIVLFVVILCAAVAALAGGMGPQTPRPPAVPAMSDDVLLELRMLRADVNRGMAASLRAQLLASRLQLQGLASEHPADRDHWASFNDRLNELEMALSGPQR